MVGHIELNTKDGRLTKKLGKYPSYFKRRRKKTLLICLIQQFVTICHITRLYQLRSNPMTSSLHLVWKSVAPHLYLTSTWSRLSSPMLSHLSRGFLAAAGNRFAPDIPSGLQTFRVRWTQGECCALIQVAARQMDNGIVHGGFAPIGDGEWLVVRCPQSLSSVGLGF